MKKKIIAEALFLVAMFFAVFGGYTLADGNILGISFICIGFLFLLGKWKYEDINNI